MLTKLHPTRGTAYVALVTGSVIALVLVNVLHYTIGDTRLSSVMINLRAILSYLFEFTAFIMLRIREPERPRPYKIPFGIPGTSSCASSRWCPSSTAAPRAGSSSRRCWPLSANATFHSVQCT
ncbi:hypothetical protein PF005_g28035 [Phytophthora fragariae]|uniref:Uncharacterized protein n=1 Tax=Phytophthora fragariae TaxID=53985 RepID=A0A6A3VZ84_9STRA|nr:hypothetical protein PF003_g25248 [Phytophthora fragariae]KAE8921135.1 hypothetical protein PF009_g28579 [Phytophthora fragariae]KAE8968877.1 hypothetical protein PF011_g27024 [Phytophthora fragariae]KAE9067687.1 hypothetical protein PF007_g27976 [Phytophthora fragariae]KAE9072236.1 hypothetical protein PF010_g25565 [Phytophthora fragariae]